MADRAGGRTWYRDVVVATAMVEALEALPLRWPPARIDFAAFGGHVSRNA